MAADIDRILDELGVRAQPTPPKPSPRPDPRKDKGVWYPDGNIPH